MEYRTYSVQRSNREPLLRFMVAALEGAGCRIIFCSQPDRAPFRITFETAEGEKLGIVAYAFLANSKTTKNRPADEHRFQIKYGSKEGSADHELWQDPYGLYTTLLVGINVDGGFFVGADPVLNSEASLLTSKVFTQRHVDAILNTGWQTWEMENPSQDEPVEVLVGATARHFLSYVRFERAVVGEDQGHRQQLAEAMPQTTFIS